MGSLREVEFGGETKSGGPNIPRSIVMDFKEKLIQFLKDNNAEIRSGCQTGCDLELIVDGVEVATFCAHIPERS